MMDELIYRIPGADPVHLKGCFLESCDAMEASAFVLSDYSGKHLYTFRENVFPKAEASDFSFHIATKEEYLKQVEFVLSQIKSGVFKKLVLSRIVASDFAGNPMDIFSRACTAYPKAFVYYFKSKLLGEWLGASPELLLRSSGTRLETVALAGTRPAFADAVWGKKEEIEQEFVTSYILEVLKGLQVNDLKVDKREEVYAGPVKHLQTKIRFQSNTPVTTIVNALHPTPAVCGNPKLQASEGIRTVEPHERSLYSGFIGLLGKETELFVNLRCMQVHQGKAYVYVGGGITEDSNPEAEWEETTNKAHTLLRLMEKM